MILVCHQVARTDNELNLLFLTRLKRHDYFVYILLCSDGTYYTGVTNDYERRLEEHQSGYNPKSYTHSRRPIKLKLIEQFHDIDSAILREKQLKKWSKAKKQALIEQNEDFLADLSKKRFNK